MDLQHSETTPRLQSLPSLLARRGALIQSQTEMCSLVGLASISQKLGIAPAGETEITKENVSSWINAASSALTNSYQLEAYSAILQGQLAIEAGEAPSFTRDARRFPATEVYLDSLQVILRLLDRHEAEGRKEGEAFVPYFFKEETWTKEWNMAVDHAVLFRESIKSAVETEPLDIAPTGTTPAALSWDDSRFGSHILDAKGHSILRLKGGLLTSIQFDGEHPWWQASTPTLRKPINFKNILLSTTTNTNPFAVLHTRSPQSNTLEGVVLGTDKYPDLTGTEVTLHFVVQPLPLLKDEERVLYAPIIPVSKGRYFIDTITATSIVIERVHAEFTDDDRVPVFVQNGSNTHPFESLPRENIGSWRSEVASNTSPWIDRNALIVVKSTIPGKDADFLRDLLHRGIKSFDPEKQKELIANCLARRPKKDWEHFLNILVDKELIASTDTEVIKSHATKITPKTAQSTRLTDYLSGYKGYGIDSPVTMRGDALRGGGFNNLHTGAAVDISLGASEEYNGPEVDCDPMGKVHVFVIMPVAVNDMSDPTKMAQDWLKAFGRAALGN